MRFRSVFFGTPEFAVPILEALCDVSEVVAVVCQPDRRAGRGMKMQAPAVKQAALRRDIEVHQPTRVRDGSLAQWLRELSLDVAIVAAYGRILPKQVLEAPRHGCINLHASLLPAYRGAAPIERAILCGEDKTGVSLMQMDEGMDTGPVFATRSTPIPIDITGNELRLQLSKISAEMVKQELVRALRGELHAIPQSTVGASNAPPLTRADFALDFGRQVRWVHNRVRALAPRPGADALLNGGPVKVLKTHLMSGEEGQAAFAAAGSVRVESGRAWVRCADGWLELLELKLAGRPARSVRDLINGRAVSAGCVLERP